MTDQVVIYALYDPLTGERRYIGKANDLASRVRCHRWEAKSSSFHTHKANWLRSLSCDPRVEVLETCSKETWAEAERRWIAVARANGERLTNFADGGQTSPVEGRGHTEETKQKCREATLRRGAKPPSRKGQSPWNKGLTGSGHPNLTTYRVGQTAWNKGIKRTHCPQGHLYSPDNTRIVVRPDRNQQYQSCRICERRTQAKYQLRRAA